MGVEIAGTCHDAFASVREGFRRNLASGADVGASVAVCVDGELVVDLWGGHADGARTRPWERDTIANVWSTTKTMTALVALILADRGALDLDAPVAAYWPEFGANGKQGVLVRHVLAHAAGLPGWDGKVTREALYAHGPAVASLAAAAPWWEPGTASGYHAFTQGHLIGELVRRVTGRSLGAFFADEIAAPLGADFHIGLAAQHDGRVAEMIPPPPAPSEASEDGGPIARRALLDRELRDPAMANSAAWRRAEVPAANGHGNARSVARVQSIVACVGTLDGIRFLAPQTCERIFEEQTCGDDLVTRMLMRYGIGYGLGSDLVPLGPRACFWGGWGGSICVIDLGRRLVAAYVMNRMADEGSVDTRGFLLALAALGAAGSS